jgi:hypothetical protein
MAKSLDRQHSIRKLAKRMIDNRNNYKKILKEIETEAKTLLDMPGTVLYQIALHLNANHVLKDCD